MGKADFLSPKAISNRIKSKGLQKLRWYCQMCQKQCRDENGFKCHCMSESHQRQLLLASENPTKFMDYFSDEFKSDFLELLRRRFGTKRVHNNIVYNEYISHREHVHMNSTQWETLTDFTKWLGRKGLCKVDETPKGWYIQYVDRDPETIRRQEEQARKKKQELDDEERSAKFIQEQVRRGMDGKEAEAQPVYTELKRESEEEKVAFNLSVPVASSSRSSSVLGASSVLGPLKAPASLSSVKRKEAPSGSDSRGEKKKKSALEEIMELEEKKKKKQSSAVRTDYWLQPNIVVKIVTKKLGEKYHKKKAVVMEVKEKYGAVVKLIDSGDKLKLDQNHLETVIPAPGKRVLILNGPYRDTEALLEGIDEKKFSATLTLDSGPQKGDMVDIAYEDFSKLA
ncbi:PREDICTED: DNA/RNA-binding protein KIN17 isoform X2 [Poecilia mexicana]|uniref:DNA/RNA-binding protein KIN17 isoform X2 n=1 Tax=Poecilia mexicana TaxID=48701 RepID=UPI00072E711C|nr:PREDICTED: DNA/RNA-binding protein KIN17 isoform X2 [Poecilia mexicana]